MDPKDPAGERPGNRSRRKFLGVAGVVVTAAVLAGTLPVAADQSPSPAGGATDSAASAPPLPDLTGQTGVLWGLKYDPHVEAYQRMVDAFNKKTGAQMTVVPVDPGSAGPPGALGATYLAAVASGTQPDVMVYYGASMVPLYMQDSVMPIKDSVYAVQGVDPATDFIGDAMGPWVWQGEYYGVPLESNGVGSMVNVPVDDLQALGLADKFPPSNGQTFFDSYDSMYELAQALQTKDGDTVTRWGLSSKGFEFESLAGIMASLGVDWWDPAAKKFNFDTPEGAKAFDMLVAKPVALGIETELDQSATQAALAGKVALSRGDGGPSVVGADAGFAFELAGAPRVTEGEDPTLIGGGGWGVFAPAQAKNPELSLAFLRFMATEEGQMEYAKIYDGLLNFAWADFADDTTRFADPTEANALFRAAPAFTAMALRTKFFGEGYGYYGEMQKAAGDVSSQVRQGLLTPEQGAAELQKRAEAQYAQFLTDLENAG